MNQLTIQQAREALSDDVIDAMTGSEAREALKLARDQHLGDLETIASTAHAAAEAAGHCSTYDQIFGQVADATSVRLPGRTRSYEFWVDVPVRVPVNVQGESLEDAKARVAADPHLMLTSVEVSTNNTFVQGNVRDNVRRAFGYWEHQTEAIRRATVVA